MSAKSALFCMAGMCLGSIGTTLGIVGCVHICWSGTFLWRGRAIGPKSVYKCLWWVRMWNECKKCTVLYGEDVPGFDWYHTWNCGVRAYMLVCWAFVERLLSVCWALVERLLSVVCWAFVERLLSVCWAFVECLLSVVCWAFVKRLLRVCWAFVEPLLSVVCWAFVERLLSVC